MTHRLHRLWSALLLAMPGAAYALGLGEIHLESGLNQPLAAQIELVGATTEELTQLRASVASRETFLRYGVDRPAFLSSISFKVGQDGTGHSVLIVRSNETVTEPFVTFLVDVTWPRGKLTREYTLLLDPPVFDTNTPANAAAPEVQAPVSGATTGQKAAPITRRAEAPVAVQAPTGDSLAGSSYTVVANDTLGGIARRAGATSRGSLNKAMISIFRANPRAFDGNINRLHRGATLAIPDAAELAAMPAAEASREVHEQMQAWRGGAGAPATQSAASGEGAAGKGKAGARLRLVMPNDATDKSAASAAAAEAAKSKAPTPAQAAETKRLLDLKNDALAKLQAAAPAPAQPAVAQGKPATPAVPAPATGAQATAPAAAPATGADAKPKAKPHAKIVPPPEPGLLDSISGLLVPIAGGIVLLLAAGAAFLFLRKRRAAEVSEALGQFDSGSASARADREHAFADPMEVEETARQDEPVARQGGSFDPSATMSSEAAINLEHADPLAEADFHMAYGLYDQAADIVKLAMEREPDRRDLRLKLLEVYFVWSNKDAFLDVARGLARDRDHAPAGEWDKVAIMGRQIAPDEALFADSAGRGAAAAGVDLDLAPDGHTDTPGMDLEFLGEDSKEEAFADIDLDLDKALAGHDGLADTGESLALREGDLDLDLDSTQERPGQSHPVEPTVERPGLSLDHTDTIDVTGLDPPLQRSKPAAKAGSYASEAPTVQAEALRESQAAETVREQINARDYATLAGSADQTAELSLDDLSFEIDQLNATSVGLQAMDHGSIETAAFASGGGGRVQSLAGEPTRIAPRPSGYQGGGAGNDDATRIAPRPSVEATQTAQISTLTASDTGDIDFDLEQLAASLDKKGGAKGAPGNGHDLDFDLSESSLSGHNALADSTQIATAQIDASELGLHDLEPATLSEVGTKIDLARAYMDMGDPEGARSILQEVLTEGSASQRQEAQRLMVGLPG